MSPRTEGFAVIPRELMHDKSISQSAKWVYVALSSRVNAAQQCWPKLQTIVEDSSLSLATVKRALQELSDKGLVTWEIRNTAGGRSSNVYTLGKPTAQNELWAQPTAQNEGSPELKFDEPKAHSELWQEEREPKNDKEPTSLRSVAQSALELVPPEPTAQTLLAEWIDHCPARPPSRVVAQISRELKAMLTEGIPYAEVREGLQQWQLKGLHPSALASVVHEMRTASSRPVTNGHNRYALKRQEETDIHFEQMLERARRLDRERGLAPTRGEIAQ